MSDDRSYWERHARRYDRSTRFLGRPLPRALALAAARDEAMAYLWAPGEPRWTVRFFFTSAGAILEDPATGSACANLGGWWIATGGGLPLTATLDQGDQAGRPSRLRLDVDAAGAIHVTGATIELGRGAIEV